MSLTWETQSFQAAAANWPHTFTPNVPAGQAQLGAFLYFEGQIKNAPGNPGSVGIDVKLGDSTIGASFAYANVSEGYTLVNAVLIPLSVATQYSIGAATYAPFSSFGTLSSECQISGTVVSLIGPAGSASLVGNVGVASGQPNPQANVQLLRSGTALAALLMTSSQIYHSTSTAGTTNVVAQGAGALVTVNGYTTKAGQSPMPPILMAAAQLPTSPDYAVTFSSSSPLSVGGTVYSTASVVELDQPDR